MPQTMADLSNRMLLPGPDNERHRGVLVPLAAIPVSDPAHAELAGAAVALWSIEQLAAHLAASCQADDDFKLAGRLRSVAE